MNALLAHAPGDELRYLAAEVDDEDRVGSIGRHGATWISGIDCMRIHR
jgi:hypothetical protein